MATEQRGALVGGGHGAMIAIYDDRSRPLSSNRCRGMELGEAGAQTLYLLLGSFASAEDARANAVVITNLLNGTGLFDLLDLICGHFPCPRNAGLAICQCAAPAGWPRFWRKQRLQR